MFSLSNHKTNFCDHLTFEIPRNKHILELSTPLPSAAATVGAEHQRTIGSDSFSLNGEWKNVKTYYIHKKNPNKPCIFLLLKINKEILQKVHNCYNSIRFWNRHNLINSVLSFPKVSLTHQQCTYLHSQKGSFCMRTYRQQCDKPVCISGNWGGGGAKYCFLQTLF